MANLIAAAIFCVILLPNGQSQSLPDESTEPMHYLVIGNPGVGKSATLNSLIGTARFEANINMGGGLTQKVQIEQFGPDLFMDSPGLADVEIRDEAANEIVKALKLGGLYKIMFVLTLENCQKRKCQVRGADKATIQLVLKAAPDITDYGVMINKLTKNSMGILHDRSDPTYGQLLASLMAGLPTTSPYLHFNPWIEALDEGENVLMPDDIRAEILAFLDRIPPVSITPERVSAIETEAGFDPKLKDRILSDEDKVKAREEAAARFYTKMETEMSKMTNDDSAIDEELEQVQEQEVKKAKKRKSWPSRIGGWLEKFVGGTAKTLTQLNEVAKTALDVLEKARQIRKVLNGEEVQIGTEVAAPGEIDETAPQEL